MGASTLAPRSAILTESSQLQPSSFAESMTDAAPAWLEERERGTATAFRLMVLLANYAPRWVSEPAIWTFSLYFTLRLSATATQGVSCYLTRVLSRPLRFADRHRLIRQFAHVTYDRVRLLSTGFSDFAFTASGHEVVMRRQDEGRGGVFLGAHFGSFEALRAFDRMLPGLSIRYLMFEDHVTKSASMLRDLNPEVARHVISLTDGTNAMLAMREALEEGHFVAFLGDRMPSSNPRSTVVVEFLGGKIAVPRAPYVASLLAEVPLILCFCPRVPPRTAKPSGYTCSCAAQWSPGSV